MSEASKLRRGIGDRAGLDGDGSSSHGVRVMSAIERKKELKCH